MELNEKDIQRFWSLVDKSDDQDGCWEWQGNVTRYGYGITRVPRGPKTYWRAHRLSYLLSYGVDPAALCVCHACDNRLCVRPEHLWLGTLADNTRDMFQKKRHRPRVKYSEDTVNQAFVLRALGHTLSYISGLLGMSIGHTGRILNGGMESGRVSSVKKGTAFRPQGESHYLAKVANTDAVRMRELYTQGVSQAQIAREFRVRPLTVHRIVHYQTYTALSLLHPIFSQIINWQDVVFNWS